jgi:hypothetical protein
VQEPAEELGSVDEELAHMHWVISDLALRVERLATTVRRVVDVPEAHGPVAPVIRFERSERPTSPSAD